MVKTAWLFFGWVVWVVGTNANQSNQLMGQPKVEGARGSFRVEGDRRVLPEVTNGSMRSHGFLSFTTLLHPPTSTNFM